MNYIYPQDLKAKPKSKVIDNNQMVKLNTVLEEIMADTDLAGPLKSSEELLEMFLNSNRLEFTSKRP